MAKSTMERAAERITDGSAVIIVRPPTAQRSVRGLPGSSTVGARHRALQFLGIEVRDVPDDTPDEGTAALVAAIRSLSSDEYRTWTPAQEQMHPRGPGGKFRKLTAGLAAALHDFLKGDGPSNPLDKFNREQVRRAAKELEKDGMPAMRRGASEPEIKAAILDHVRQSFREVAAADKAAPKVDGKFTLKGKAHRNKDVGVYHEPDGKVSLYEESGSGARGARVVTVDDLAGLEKWANDNGEPELATWARSEGGMPAVPVKKASPAKTNEALLGANQERQAVIDKARTAGHVASDFAELDYNSGDPAILRERIDTLAQKARDDVSHGATLPDGLDKLEQAAATGDAAKMRRAVATFARANGITIDGKPGGRDKFDPTRHEAQGSRPAVGAAVEVIRPGVSTSHNGEDIQVTKPLVVDVSPDPAKAVKKATPAAKSAPPPPPPEIHADAGPARAELDGHLTRVGRRKPAHTEAFDRAAQSLADGADRKAVAAQLRKDATNDKSLSAEDVKTYQVLAAEIGRQKPRPAWLNEEGNVNLDVLLADNPGAQHLADLPTRDYLEKARRGELAGLQGDKPWTREYESVRQDLAHGTVTQKKAVDRFRTLAAGIRRKTAELQGELDAKARVESGGHGSYRRLGAHELKTLAAGPAAADAYDQVADALAATKVPTKPRQASLGGTEIGEVLPIDESRFVHVAHGDLVSSRGEVLGSGFRHKGIFLFPNGASTVRSKRPELTPAENDALDYYTIGRLARSLNGSLRKGKNHHGEVAYPEIGLSDKIDLDAVRADLDTAIENSELTHDAVLWRGVLLKAADRNRLVPGAILSDSGFSSTTSEERDADKVIRSWSEAGLYKGTKPAKFRILAPKGTNGAVGHQGVHEVLLARDQKFRVIREEVPDAAGTPVYVLEAVPPETSEGMVRGRGLLDAFDYSTVESQRGFAVFPSGVQQKVYAQQGFDGHPTVGTKEEVDAAVARGAIEMFRGIRPTRERDSILAFPTGERPKITREAGDMAEQFRSGDLHYGEGGAVYGRGTYASPEREFADLYAGAGSEDPGVILRMALRRDARVITYDDLKKLHLKAMPQSLRDLDAQQSEALAAVDPSDTSAVQEILARFQAKRSKVSGRQQAIFDLGNFGALMGYDAVVVPKTSRSAKGKGSPTEYVVLNRTALIIQEADKS